MKRRAILKKGMFGLGAVGTVGALSACNDARDPQIDTLKKALDEANQKINRLETTQVAAPAVAKGIREIVMVSTWPRDFPGVGTGAQRLAKRIEQISGGQMIVNYYAAGELVKAFDAFDAVASGDAQMYHAADYYWKGKNPAWAYFTTVPFGLSCSEMNAWVRFGGGQALWDELAAEFGLKNLPAGNTGMQMGGWFRKEINSPDDFSGLKMRMPGLGGDMISRLGASTVSLPASQIYENLISGAIDAAEWVGPWNDTYMKFYEAAKYYYFPGVQEPSGMGACGMNKRWWDSLDSTEQAVIQAATAEANDLIMSEFTANNASALDALVANEGVKLRQFNDDIYAAFAAAAEEVYADAVAYSPLVKRIHNSFQQARTTLSRWSRIADQFNIEKRNQALGL